MHLRHRLRPVFFAAPLALLGGCDDSDDSGDEHEDGDTEAADCSLETRDDEFSIGLSKSGALVTATFVSADPAPPAEDDNTWVLRFTDVGGEALEGLTIVVNPTMPDHGHGTPVIAEVMPTSTVGEYQISPVNLFMPGYWDVELSVTLAGGGGEDTLSFGFCVE